MELYAWVVFFLLVKHFVADFPLQTKFMLRKGNQKDWELPLLSHAGVHAGLTYLVLAAFALFTEASLYAAVLIAVLDGWSHFLIDYVKAQHFRTPNQFSKRFWNFLGADQLAHQTCYLFWAWLFLTTQVV